MSNRKCYFFLILLNYPQPFSFEQIDMFGEADEQKRNKSLNKEKSLDKIKQKFGFDSIVRGSSISTDIGIERKRKTPERAMRKNSVLANTRFWKEFKS